MTETVLPDSAIPKPLREAIRRRRNAAIALHQEIHMFGLSPKVFQLVDRLSDLNRSLRQREWIPRPAGFDPISLGM